MHLWANPEQWEHAFLINHMSKLNREGRASFFRCVAVFGHETGVGFTDLAGWPLSPQEGSRVITSLKVVSVVCHPFLSGWFLRSRAPTWSMRSRDQVSTSLSRHHSRPILKVIPKSSPEASRPLGPVWWLEGFWVCQSALASPTRLMDSVGPPNLFPRHGRGAGRSPEAL